MLNEWTVSSAEEVIQIHNEGLKSDPIRTGYLNEEELRRERVLRWSEKTQS